MFINCKWDHLIHNKRLLGIESNQKFYHLNTKEIYDKILCLKTTD